MIFKNIDDLSFHPPPFFFSRIQTNSMEKHLPANYNPEDYPPVKMRNKRE